MTASHRRVLVIGLDGATLDLIEPWAAAGYLPNLARLMATGSYGRLASTLHPVTAPAWVTFMTGVNQGKHGLYDFVRRRAGGYELEVTNASHFSTPTIFEIASQLGRRIITVNIPYTFPPRPINGIMVGGPFAAAATQELVYPPAFFDTLKTLVPDYFILPDYNAHATDPLAAFREQILKEVEQRERLGLHLMQTEPWDLLAVVFMATDEVQHTYWHCYESNDDSPEALYRHTIRDVYQRVDQAIGAFLAQAAVDESQRETIVAVLSDHGGGPLRWLINLNHWLAAKGYLRFQSAHSGLFRRTWVVSLDWMAYVYRHYVSSRIRALIRNFLGAQRFNRLKGEFESVLVTATVDWDHSQAYALGTGGNIFINLRGRESAGIVEPGNHYEHVCQAIAEDLMTLADPETKRPIVHRVYRREEIYHGPFLSQAPDLIIEWADYAYWGRGSYGQPEKPIFEALKQFDFSGQPMSGSHRPEGVLIFQGPGIRPGGIIQMSRLIDMAPTLLSLLGIEPPANMDGRVLQAVFTPDTAVYGLQTLDVSLDSPPEHLDYSPEEAEKISEHLRSLGYL